MPCKPLEEGSPCIFILQLLLGDSGGSGGGLISDGQVGLMGSQVADARDAPVGEVGGGGRRWRSEVAIALLGNFTERRRLSLYKRVVQRLGHDYTRG